MSNTYAGDKQAFLEIQQYFEDANRFTEAEWKQKKDEENRVVFAKGKSVAFTFNYESSVLEIRTIVDYSEDERIITVSVGNSGFPFEAKVAKPRYQELLNKIDTWIMDSEIGVEKT
ncbi:hypothetical protein OAG71_00425 [bacterium]|nr:hypothetical protein [bacterium]